MATAIGAGPGIAKGDKFLPRKLDTREDRSQSLYCSSGSGIYLGLGDGEKSSSSTCREESSSSSGRKESSSIYDQKESSSSYDRKKSSSNPASRESSSSSARKESSSSSARNELSLNNGKREGGITSSSFVQERDCPSSTRDYSKRLRGSKEQFSYRDDMSEDVISLIGGDELNDISPMDSSSDDYKPNDKYGLVSSDEEFDEVFHSKKKRGQARMEKKMSEPRSVKRTRPEDNIEGDDVRDRLENSNVEKKFESEIETKSEEERRLNLSTPSFPSNIHPQLQNPVKALCGGGQLVGLAQGMSDLAPPLQSQLASTPSTAYSRSNIMASEGQSHQNFQLV